MVICIQGAPLADIEVCATPGGPPRVALHGRLAAAAAAAGIAPADIALTISHAGGFAVAVACVSASARKDAA